MSMTLEQIRSYALALPEATEEAHFKLTSFRVRGKIFATAPPDGEHLHLFVGEEERELALATTPQFTEKLFWGKQVAGLRVILALADARVVLPLVSNAWARKAPKSLLAKA